MNKDFKFHLGDIPLEKSMGHHETYCAAKAGGKSGAASPSFDDSYFETVNLPHDFSVSTEFSESNSLSQGYKKRGIAWYRKTFYIDKKFEDKQLTIVFEGVSTACEVYFNGSLLKRNFSGYTEFSVDISDRAFFGEKPNVLSLRVDAEAFEGWWYEGAGIYRNVYLVSKEMLHIEKDSVFVKPKKEKNNLWNLNIEISVENSTSSPENVEIENIVVLDNETVVCEKFKTDVDNFGLKKIYRQMNVVNPKLWDLDNPNMYLLDTKVFAKGKLVDEVKTPFGFRTIEVNAEKGFLLNGKMVKIKGTCNHQDHAGVGVAVPDSIQNYRIRALKEMGSNAYRCSHGMPSKAVLEACDRYGMLVVDENRNFESSEEVLKQLETMVKLARNHPSVVMYSLFNEEPLQGTPQGKRMFRRMKNTLKKLDDTRPILGAMNGTVMESDGTANEMDITGINYSTDVYDEFHRINPTQPLIGSENCSEIATRGCFKTDYSKHVLCDNDTEIVAWGNTLRKTWKAVNEREFVCGMFVWTGFDYRGEPTPFDYPSISSQFGMMDTCGFPKNAYFFLKACYSEIPFVHIITDFKNNDGKVSVTTVTNCDEVELLCDGKSLKIKKSDVHTQCVWSVNYGFKKLLARAFKNGVATAEKEIAVPDKALKLKIVPIRNYIYDDGTDTVPVNVCAVDENGTVVPNANNLVEFSLSGGGSIIGVGNGDPNCHEADIAHRRSLFAGWCQGLVRSEAGAKSIELLVNAKGLEGSSYKFKVKHKVEKIRYIESVRTINIDGWSVSKTPYNKKPNANFDLADSDMNSFEPIAFKNSFQRNFKNGYMMYKAIANIPQKGSYILEFKKVGAALAEIYCDNKLIFEGDRSEVAPIEIKLPDEIRGDHNLTVILKASPIYDISGISGSVLLR